MAMKMTVKTAGPEEYYFEGFMECGGCLLRARMVLHQNGSVEGVSCSEILGLLAVEVRWAKA
jgi:hypothetical protein